MLGVWGAESRELIKCLRRVPEALDSISSRNKIHTQFSVTALNPWAGWNQLQGTVVLSSTSIPAWLLRLSEGLCVSYWPGSWAQECCPAFNSCVNSPSMGNRQLPGYLHVFFLRTCASRVDPEI